MAEGTQPLLEREEETAAVEAGLDAAAAGSGGLFIVEGPAGIGKTAVLDAARRSARRRRMQVLTARASELERDIAHGVVRQLLELPVHSATPRRRAALLAGAAGLAAPVVLPTRDSAATGDDGTSDRRSPIVHGLYWLVANLSAEAPLLLAIDDAHWSDAGSLRFLAYLVSRLADLPVCVIATVRAGEPGVETDLLTELTLTPSVRRVRLPPLSSVAVGALARTTLRGSEPDPGLVTACRDATGGVPFLVVELLKSLAAAGVSREAASAGTITRLTSDTVAHATLLRLSRLSSDATAIAQWIAILGRHADTRRVAVLGNLDEAAVLLARDALVAAELVQAGPPMTFAHPIVRASIYRATPEGQRSIAHDAAARLLASEGADVEDVAAHLLVVEPGASADAVTTLRAAARTARTRGAPEGACAYLQRAARESGPAALRAHVLYELAQAQSVLRRPQAIATFREAMQLAAEPALRSQIVVDQVETLMVARCWDDALGEIDAALDDVGDALPETAACLEVFRAQIMAYDARLVDRFEAERARFVSLAARQGRAGTLMAALLAACAIARSDTPAAVTALATRALDGDTLMGGPDAEAWGPYAAAPLAWLGQLEVAQRAAEQMRDAAMLRGSAYGFVRGSALHALVLSRRGDLRGAEADVRAAFDLGHDGDLLYGLLLLLCWAVDALVERPQLGDVAAVFEDDALAQTLYGTYLGAWFLETRGRLRLVRGDRVGARDDLRRCGALMNAFHTVNPLLSQWRSSCALATPESEGALARALVDEELALAHSHGPSSAEVVALRVAGVLRRHEGIPLLRESLTIAEHAGAPLEKARTLIALGAALRRAHQRTAAEPPLREGLDLAHRCGADRLAGRAEEELHTLGLRPRRRALFGIDALTPSELRVAREASRGASNREIAQALFVSAKTVENQLRVTYQKLGIAGRDQLAAALAPITS